VSWAAAGILGTGKYYCADSTGIAGDQDSGLASSQVKCAE